MTRLIRLLIAVVIINSGALERVYGDEHEMGKSQIQTGITGDRVNSQGEFVGHLSPKNPAAMDERYANGLTHFYDGDFRSALKIFSKIQTVVDNARLSYLAALCQSRLGNVASARHALMGLLEMDPGHHGARMALVEIHAKSGARDAAIQQAQHLQDELIDEDHQLLLDRLKLRLEQKQAKSSYYLSVEQGLRWNSNINAGSDKSEITSPDGTLLRLDEKDRKIGDWGTTTHLYGRYRYDPQSYTSFFWDTTSSLYHVHYFEHNEFNYSNLRLKTGPVWKKSSTFFGVPLGYRASMDSGDLDSHEFFINPVFRYAFNQRWAINGGFYYGDRSYEDAVDSASDKVIRRVDLRPILKIDKTTVSIATGVLSASACDTRLSYRGVEAGLYARHSFTERTRLSIRFTHRIKKYQGIYAGWFDKRRDVKNRIHASVAFKMSKKGTIGASLGWSKNNSNTELFEYDGYTAGLNFALKF